MILILLWHIFIMFCLGAVVGAFCLSCYFLFFLVGANSIFFPLHWVGLLGFPRRISDFSLSYVWLTVFTLFGLVFLFLFCFLLFFLWLCVRSFLVFSFGFSFLCLCVFFSCFFFVFCVVILVLIFV